LIADLLVIMCLMSSDHGSEANHTVTTTTQTTGTLPWQPVSGAKLDNLAYLAFIVCTGIL